MGLLRTTSCILLFAGGLTAAGCRSPVDYADKADQAAARHIARGQEKALGQTVAFSIEPASDTLRRRLLRDQQLPGLAPATNAPGAQRLPDPLVLTLDQALRIGAAHSREYQSNKETVFASALSLDLEADAFRTSFAGALNTLFSSDSSGDADVRKITGEGSATVTRKLKAGATLTTGLAFDLAKLLTADKDSSFGLTADASITIPLLRGAGRAIATEPLTQAERNMVYAIRQFERYKQDFAVRLASDYLSVLQQLQAVHDASSNLKQVRDADERARRLSDAGRLPGIQVDQAQQDVLRAESRLNAAQQSYESRLDSFKVTLGLPADSRVTLVEEELAALGRADGEASNALANTDSAIDSNTVPATAEAPPIEEARALKLAFTNRLDFQTAIDSVADAERSLTLARDALRAGLTLTANASTRDTSELNATDVSGLSLRADRSRYGVGLGYDAPWHRTAERNGYRESLIALDRSRRNLEELEDRIKLEVRDGLRNLAEARESCRIQTLAVALARTRVTSTEIYLQAGRAEIRDVLEAQAALVNAQDALTGAIVTRRLAELNLQRSLGVLQVNPEGLWREYDYRSSQTAVE
jgi:outer membrane protein TolC